MLKVEECAKGKWPERDGPEQPEECYFSTLYSERELFKIYLSVLLLIYFDSEKFKRKI